LVFDGHENAFCLQSLAFYRIGIEDAGLKPLCSPVYNILQYNNLLISSDSHFCFRFM